MNQHEFTALQITILVRTPSGGGPEVKEFFNSTPFQYQMQDALGNLLKEQLRAGEVTFEEVIISLDEPARRAKNTRTKASLFSRLFGRG